ncbi:hypothetical protein [Corynebacterium macclintockiae]|uniref:hypothetical protein n=1 Tax=Corynebacterium macclintockiae TaxID=2913501 RepID=UPI003EBD0224
MTTRRTYELPAPAMRTRCGTFSAWHTGHSIEIDGDIDNDGAVTHNRSRGTIDVDTHEGDHLALDYNEARRVALALLAAAEEAETKKENTL